MTTVLALIVMLVSSVAGAQSNMQQRILRSPVAAPPLGSSDMILLVRGGVMMDAPSGSSGPLSIVGNNGAKISRLSDRLYVGGALSGQTGQKQSCSTGDWASKIIPASSCIGGIVSLSVPNVPYAAVFGTRTSDNPSNYAFAVAALGINDSQTAVWPVQTVYNETRAYSASSHTLGEETDIINAAIPNANVKRISPYGMIGGTPIIVNKWLSNGRPDLLTLNVGGTVTPGDVVSFTFSGAGIPSPQTVSTATIVGDTINSIAARLATAFNANAVLTAAMYSVAINNSVSVSNAPLPSVMVTTANVTGAATELAVAAYGGQASAAFGILNNSNRQQGTTTGSYLSGGVFDCLGLVGADCTDTGGFGEAIALGRKAAFAFYTPGNVAGTPASRIYSSQGTATINGLSLNFTDGETAIFEDHSGAAAVKLTKTAVIAAKGSSFTAPGAGFGELMWVAGTSAGTCKLVALAGTSATPATIIDNVGAGC